MNLLNILLVLIVESSTGHLYQSQEIMQPADGLLDHSISDLAPPEQVQQEKAQHIPKAPEVITKIEIPDPKVTESSSAPLKIIRDNLLQEATFADPQSGRPGLTLQQHATQKFINLLQDLISTAATYMKETFQQEPPCKYLFVQGGSTARSEASPFSDIDLILMIDTMNDVNYNYFIEYARKVTELIRQFGESRKSFGGKIQSTNEISGFRLCVGINPFKSAFDTNKIPFKMTNTPEEFAKIFNPMKEPVDELTDGLFFVT